MPDLVEGAARFQRAVLPTEEELFSHLAGHHTPHTLFIGCSDARVVPEPICSCEPGELYVVRTAGNPVPAYAPDADDGVIASIDVDDRRYFELAAFYDEFAKPWNERRLPMRREPREAAVDVYRFWQERNGGRRYAAEAPTTH